jgi:hypothetical protein
MFTWHITPLHLLTRKRYPDRPLRMHPSPNPSSNSQERSCGTSQLRVRRFILHEPWKEVIFQTFWTTISMKYLRKNFVFLWYLFLFRPCYGVKKDVGFEVELSINAVVKLLRVFTDKKCLKSICLSVFISADLFFRPHDLAKYIFYTYKVV